MTPEELVKHLENCAKLGFVFEIRPEDGLILLEYIRGLELTIEHLSQARI